MEAKSQEIKEVGDNSQTMVAVTLSEVMDALRLVSEYLGVKREEGLEGYDRVLVMDRDAPLVALLMEDAALLISSAFGNRLLRWCYKESGLRFEFEGEYDFETLHSALTRVIGLVVLRRWLRISGSVYADTVAESAELASKGLEIFFRENSEDKNTSEMPTHIPRASSRRLPPI